MGSNAVLRKIKYALRFLPDRAYIQLYYVSRFRRFADLKHPKTFNEKLNWLKLHDHNPLYPTLVDKYEVKQYVAEKIGPEYVIPTLGVWEHFDDIDFDSLPDQFVLKCTHDSEGVVIVRDKEKLDKTAAKQKIEAALRVNFYYIGREWPYKSVRPRIIAEQLLVDPSGDELKDYKLMCFNAEVKCTFVCSNRDSAGGLCINTYDRQWQPLPFGRENPRNPVETEKPVCYEKMVELAQTLSRNISFARVDFYEVDGRPFFGELTFYPGSGMKRFVPESWDDTLGQWLRLPGE